MSEVAIKEWTSAAHKIDNEIKLLIKVKQFLEELNERQKLELQPPEYNSIHWNVDEPRIKLHWLYNAVHVKWKSCRRSDGFRLNNCFSHS